MTLRLAEVGARSLVLAILALAFVPFGPNAAFATTPTASRTYTPSNTPLPPTLTPTPPYYPLGDADCNQEVTSPDAAVILQIVSGLLITPPCPARADVDRDNRITSVDATLVLQYSAGLLSSLPTPTATLTPTITRTPTATTTPTPTLTPYAVLVGAEFTIELDVDGDGTADCSTRVPGPKQCVLNADGDLTARLSLDALPAGLSYAGYSAVIEHEGLDLVGEPDTALWPDCVFWTRSMGVSAWVNFGCGIDIGPSESTYTGPLSDLTFRATCDASLTLSHGTGGTFLWNRRDSDVYVEAMEGEETLQLSCAKGFTPLPTPTFTPADTPTTTPTSTPCPPQGCPSPSPTRTRTATPT